VRLRKRTARLALATAGVFIGALASAAPGMAAAPETVYGLTVDDQLTVFRSDQPGNPTVIGPITSLNGGDNLVGLDFRPATGQLYALGKDGGGNGQLYRIDPVTADAAAIGGQAGGTLTGTQHGFDFNPVPDRIRVVNNEPDDNLRLNPRDGTQVDGDNVTAGVQQDGPLTFAAGDVNAGQDPSVEAVAYTNSIGGSSATRLFGIDTTLNVVTQFGPGNADPNNGQMTTRGPLGFDVDEVAGFDITPGGSQALAALRPAGATRPKLYSIDTGGPGAGASRDLGTIGSAGATPGPVIEDIAIAPSVREFVALTDGSPQRLLTFFSNAPDNTNESVAVTGLPAGVGLVGIDTRPANGQLVGVGDDERLYTLDPGTGAATVVGTGPFSPSLSGTGFGVDFNPVPDRLRVTSTDEQNLRINPATGAGAGTAPPSAADTALTGVTSVVGSAYTNSEPGAANTTLYNVDSAADQLTRQGDVDGAPASPNGGANTNIGALGIDVGTNLGYDIVPEDNQGFVVADPQGTPNVDPTLYSVNPGGAAPTGPGTAVPVGAIVTFGEDVVGLAFLDDTVFSTVNEGITAGEGDGQVNLFIERSGDLDRSATVSVRTVNGSATSPADYGAVNTTVTFDAGETIRNVSVPINNDALDEPDEAFTVLISPVTGRVSQESTAVRIADNDDKPSSGGGNNGGGNNGGGGNSGGGSNTSPNVINGTAGNDTINGTTGDDIINCGSGNDVVRGGGGDDVINCGTGDDRVRGGSGDDRISGEGGNDRLNGDSGNDRISGGSGNDRVGGDSGDDRLRGDSGNDRVSGGSGDDSVSGGSGNDRLSGGNGRDRIAGDSGRDRLSGGDGRDRLNGGSGNDRLSGGDGRDRLIGGPGRDRARQ